MPPLAIAGALFAALIHASWNALLKSGRDRLADSALVACGWAALGAALIGVNGLPDAAAWPYLLASAMIHGLYWGALSKGYEAGDLSHVYTLSRGAAPILIAIGAALTAREIPGPSDLIGISFVSLGVLCVGASPHAPVKATLWALVIAICIMAYSLIDALGARKVGVAYVGAMLVADAIPIALFCIVRRGPVRLLRDARADWGRGALAGVVSGGGFGIVLWAQMLAPVAQVSALRETSVVFAALIAWIFLKERLGARRWIGALIVAAGALLIGLG